MFCRRGTARRADDDTSDSDIYAPYRVVEYEIKNDGVRKLIDIKIRNGNGAKHGTAQYVMIVFLFLKLWAFNAL